jgi:hypothetical protein
MFAGIVYLKTYSAVSWPSAFSHQPSALGVAFGDIIE